MQSFLKFIFCRYAVYIDIWKGNIDFFPDAPQREIYFMALIDVLTHYGVKKQAAKAAKTVKYGSNADGISTVEPEQYGRRFLDFMNQAIV